jgi:uncharacterized membrane protein YcaP (DUF421 family)
LNQLWFDISVYVAKTAVVVLYLFLGYRLLGKRQVAQFNLYDLATIIAVANAVQNAMTRGKGDLIVGVACSMTLILIGWFFSRVLVRAPKMQGLVFGTPTIILSDGHALPDRMHRERITMEELDTAIRQHGLTDHSQVALAVLEVDGAISVVPKR